MTQCGSLTLMPKPKPDELLTATQVGTLINRSGRTVLRLADDGQIPIAAKLPGPNGAHLFKRADAEKLAKKFDAERRKASA